MLIFLIVMFIVFCLFMILGMLLSDPMEYEAKKNHARNERKAKYAAKMAERMDRQNRNKKW